MTIYLNGQFMPIEEAKVSVLDRGFIFGDGVYEVIPVYSRKAFRLEEHLRRLQHSLDGIKLANPHSRASGPPSSTNSSRAIQGEDQYLYLHITRGVAKRDHAFPKPPVTPTVFMMSSPLSTPARRACCKAAWPALPRRTTAGCAATSSPSRCCPMCCCARWRSMPGAPKPS